MTPRDLVKACDAWLDKPDESEFAVLVTGALQGLGILQRDLAQEFEVQVSTVSRWASGASKPHPRLQRQVIQSIRRRAERAAR